MKRLICMADIIITTYFKSIDHLFDTNMLPNELVTQLYEPQKPQKVFVVVIIPDMQKTKSEDAQQASPIITPQQESLIAEIEALLTNEKALKEEKMNFSNIAQLLNVSKKEINDAFKAKYNITYTEYLRNKRFDYACTLLKTSQDKIWVIAEEAGFSVRTLQRLFKKKKEITPSQYKRTFHSVA